VNYYSVVIRLIEDQSRVHERATAKHRVSLSLHQGAHIGLL
jgi:hypothetical protein